MNGVTVFLAKAIICFANVCHPALVGDKTLVGEYQIAQRFVESPGYGGDVLQFRELEHSIQAIHRPWLGKPSQRRLERLKSPNSEDRKGITNGCINVEEQVYDALVDCCSGSKLTVAP